MGSDGLDSTISDYHGHQKITTSKGNGQLSQQIVPHVDCNRVYLHLTIFSTTASAGLVITHGPFSTCWIKDLGVGLMTRDVPEASATLQVLKYLGTLGN